jgi:hypothetical protein
MDFNFDRLANDINSGLVKNAEIRIDPAHNFKPEHLDVHIFYQDRNATKLTNLTGVDALKDSCPWMVSGSTLNL